MSALHPADTGGTREGHNGRRTQKVRHWGLSTFPLRSTTGTKHPFQLKTRDGRTNDVRTPKELP